MSREPALEVGGCLLTLSPLLLTRHRPQVRRVLTRHRPQVRRVTHTQRMNACACHRIKGWPMAYDAPGGGIGRYARPA
eukprot:5253222-Prymnesium_polylepis.1